MLLTLCAAVLCGVFATIPGKTVATERSVASLRFIGEQRIASRHEHQATMMGGLSGIDYDPKSDSWIIQSDDKSDINPARFYKARLNYDLNAFSAIELTGVSFFKQADGSHYPNIAQFARGGGDVPDIESVRFDPFDGSVWYASEGSRKIGLSPSVRHASAEGSYLSVLPLPAIFKVPREQESGPRNNLSFEGLSFSPDGHSLWVGMEGPLYEDGAPPATTGGAIARMTRYDRDGKVLAQYAYPLDAIPAMPDKGRYADNGVSEILAINYHQLLVIERSGVQREDGVFEFYIRIYEMDTAGASDVKNLATLKHAGYTLAKKRLVLDLSTIGLAKIDNIEGIAWGRKLANGHDSVVLVSDDNFDPTQVTQLLVFEVLPK